MLGLDFFLLRDDVFLLILEKSVGDFLHKLSTKKLATPPNISPP